MRGAHARLLLVLVCCLLQQASSITSCQIQSTIDENGVRCDVVEGECVCARPCAGKQLPCLLIMSLLFLHEKLSSGFAGSSICSNHFQISSLVFWDGMWWCFSICKYLISEVCSLAMHWHFSTTFLFYLCCVLDFSWQCSKRTSTTLVKLRRCAKDYVSKLAFATTLQCRWTCACTCIRVFSTRQSRSQ